MAEDPYRALGEALGALIRAETRAALAEALAEILPQLIPPPVDATAMVDVSEAAVRLGIGTTKAKELIAASTLPSVLIGRRRKVPIEAIDTYVRRRLQESEQLALPGLRDFDTPGG
jgi:excisionase family DNA binding protein